MSAEGLECINCHEDAAAFDDPGMPTLDSCSICHDVLDEEAGPGAGIEPLFDEQGSFLSTRVSALDDEVRFLHLRHVEAVEDCGACHRGIEGNRRVDETLAVAMDDCTSCHQTRQVANDCATCHSELGRETAPDTHHQGWVKAHGRASRAGADAVAMRCDLCHESSSCEACHLVTPPQNHTNFWRRRGHAITSRMDRKSCFACHRADFCDRCHESARPMNHVGMWGGTRSAHCLTCHFPLQDSGCVACHRRTPSHSLAPPKPAWHQPSFDCRSCHGFGQLPLSHVDDGSNCNLCHL